MKQRTAPESTFDLPLNLSFHEICWFEGTSTRTVEPRYPAEPLARVETRKGDCGALEDDPRELRAYLAGAAQQSLETFWFGLMAGVLLIATVWAVVVEFWR